MRPYVGKTFNTIGLYLRRRKDDRSKWKIETVKGRKGRDGETTEDTEKW